MQFADGEADRDRLTIDDVDRHIGGYGLSGKTVLDVGTASGYVAVYARTSGATLAKWRSILTIRRNRGRAMTRQERLLEGLAKDAKIIEIGPSFNPLAPKREGWNTLVVDHASRAELVSKYTAHGMDPASIEEVDYVWRGGSVAQAVPEAEHGTFDAFIASHVIEHTTDVVRFLQAAQTLLAPEGVTILAVPDKRKCFDFYRHPSSTADAIVAYEERRDRHVARTHIDYGMRMVLKGGHPAWAGDDTRQPRLSCGLDEVPHWLHTATMPDYHDAHNWVFVPASFRLMILELGLIGYTDLRVERWAEAPDTEFYAWLRKGAETIPAEAVQDRRRALLDQQLIELADQTRQIVGSPLYVPPAPPTPEPIAAPERRASPLGWLNRRR